MKQNFNGCDYPFYSDDSDWNQRLRNLNGDIVIIQPPFHLVIDATQGFHNNIGYCGGVPASCNNPRQQENQATLQSLINMFSQQDIFQDLKYHIILLQRLIESEGIEQLKKVGQWLNSKENIYSLSNQGKLNQTQIEIIETAIGNLLLCVLKSPIHQAFNLLQFTQNLFQVLFQQFKIFNCYTMKNLHKFSDNLELIKEKYQHEKGLDVLFEYQLQLMKDAINYQQDGNVKILEKFIYEQNKYQNQNELIFKLFQDANNLLLDNNNKEYDKYYFFQQLKLTIIRMITSLECVDVKQIVKQLQKGYQLCIQNNQNWKVQLGFLQILLELISLENYFTNDVQKDLLIGLFNELSSQLIKFQIQENINIWEHYIKTKCTSSIKCYLAFCLTINKNQQEQKDIKLTCIELISLFLNCEQDENARMILQNEKIQGIQENSQEIQESYQLLKPYKLPLKNLRQKLQEEFIFNQQNQIYINIPLKVSREINHYQQNSQQNSDKSIYLFKEVASFEAEQVKTYEVNDFLWRENNNSDLLLVQGMAGSGKSSFLKQLQLFLIKHYESISKQKKWVPILIRLANLEESNQVLWSQLLNAGGIFFNDEQIKSFTDDIQNGELNIVILFDGLDEMRYQIYEKYILCTKNHFEKQLGNNVKIITTSSESFISKKQIVQSYNLLTEIQIQIFDDLCIEEYLKQYQREVVRLKLYRIQGQQQQDAYQFSELWAAYFLDEVNALVEKTSNHELIFADELIDSMQPKIQRNFQNILEDHLSELKNDLKTIQSTGELMKKLNNNQNKNLTYTPLTLKLVLQLLSDIDKKVHKKKLEKMFNIALQKLKIEQIKSIDQKEKENMQDYSEYVNNLMIALREKKYFDNFSFENLSDEFSEVEQSLIKQAANQTQFTQYQFYKLFVTSYHQRQMKQEENQKKLNFSQEFSKNLNKFQMLLAVQMIKKQPPQLDKKEIQNILTIYFTHDPHNYLLIKLSLLNKLDNDCYTFVNQSILEYFVGKYILKLIKDFSKDFKKKLFEKDIESSQFNQDEFNLSLDQFQQVLINITPELQNQKDIKQTLIKILLLSRNEIFIRAGSNSILLINMLGFELINEDLRGIKLNKTNLSGLNFFGSNLDQSMFKEVSINYCNFNNTSLQRVIWTEIPWNNFVDFKNQNQAPVILTRPLTNNSYLISQDKQSVKLWNLQTQKIHKIINENLNVRIFNFSSDSTKLLVDFLWFYQIYHLNKNDIRLVATIPQPSFYNRANAFLSSFYDREDKLLFREAGLYGEWYTYNLKNVIQSKPEWIKSTIFDKSTKFSCVKPMSYGETLIGYQNGEIIIWDIRQIMLISKNDHQSAIKSLSEKTLRFKPNNQEYFTIPGFVSLLISTSEEQVIVWLRTQDRYERVNALSSKKKVNGQLPRFLNFSQGENPNLQQQSNKEDYLVSIRNEYIIFHDISKIIELNDDIIMRDVYCMAIQEWTMNQWQQQQIKIHQLFVARGNFIEVYENYPNCKDRIPLQSCQPLSMYFCSNQYMVSYNQDKTIRFWYIQNNIMGMQMVNQMDSFMMENQFNQSHLIRGSINGYVQNLRQSYKWIVVDQTIKIAVQQNKQQVNIYNVQIQRDGIQYDQGPEQRCLKDQTIGCFALFGNGEQICLGINNLIEIRDLKNNQTITLQEIHTQDIYQVLFNENESLLVSCSYDNSIVIWNTDNLNQNYCIKNLKCLDIVFESTLELVVQTENSIIWYKILYDFTAQIIRFLDSQEINSLTQQMAVVQLFKIVGENQNLNLNQNQKQFQYLAIKQGNNIILKNFQKGDQTKVATFNEQDKNIEFASKHFIVYTIKSSNVLEVADIDDRKVIMSLKFCQFAITERVYPGRVSCIIIVVETITEIMVTMIPNQQTQVLNKFECIKKKDKGIQTHLALSESGHFLAFNNNQQIAIYLITEELKLIQMSTFSIDIEISNLYILETGKILIRSYDFLYQYSLNLEKTRIFSENWNNQDYYIAGLNHNEKLLAKISDKFIDFISLQNYQNLERLHGSLFTTSLDNKNFVIYKDNQIKCYNWEEQIKFLYKFNIQNNIYNLTILKDPNQILAVTSNNLKIINCKENQTKNIQGSYYPNAYATADQQIVQIERSTIRISQTEYNIKLYYPENFGYMATNPFFTQDGQYIVYQQNNNVIFQSLSNPRSKYNPEQFQKLTPISFLSESNYLVTLKKKQCRITNWDISMLKDEYYLKFWDVTVLSNVKSLFKIPILKEQTKKMFYQQSFISQIEGNVLCMYDIKEFQKQGYDTNLYNQIENVHYAGLFPEEKKFYSVSKLDNSITIYSMKTREKMSQEFKDHQSEILYISLSQDEKYMISRDINTIIVRNMQNGEKQIIKRSFKNYLYKNVYTLYKCDFVTLDNSMGITCQEQGDLHIYDLKDFKSYELFHTQTVNLIFPTTFTHKVFSNGTKIALFKQYNSKIGTKILIFDVRTKQVINTLNLSAEQIFLYSYDSDEYYVQYLDKRYNVYQVFSRYSYKYSKDNNLLQIYKNHDLIKEDAKPIYEVFIQLHTKLDNTEQTLIQINYVGRKYLTYYFNQQLRVIDLKLYSKQVKLIKLDKSEKFLNYFSKDQVLFESKIDQYTTWNSYSLIDGSKKELFNHNLNEFIAVFSNNGQYLAQGWKDGLIRIYKISTEKQNIAWLTHKAIKHLIYTKDDKILISCSENNLVQFWDVQEEKKEKLIQSIQITYDILSIVVSPNKLDVALELKGNLLLILTYNKSNSIYENQNQKFVGCYKTYPQLQQLMTENCRLENSIIEDQKKQSLIHHFDGIIQKEYESVTIQQDQI
ncbi:unnamed protein product (macronuclear) [Paramecium tetraurelia]|uniref:NACHT domain-containing protein n=1 Tax=Paramecium tetraurelia TaxID=5888 RepID=A0EA61_PARTE|nr:uncharacterized protein GSPATT00024910001 [Paramecium tetraurelia]CAK92178.1 unnamed protein product [Paramecium tetraurelia]|eukprot:XP_001459575.1 hypothetical protein (macronuclear) [Paramecium tetraurelia strain d4-2]